MANNSLYSSSPNLKDSNRTYIPDIYRQSINELESEQTKQYEGKRTLAVQERHIVGVLYSISASPNGEIFPLYIGRNTIGMDKSCDVYLPEATVSANHAIILARNQKDENGKEKVVFSITDYDSEYGSMVNDVRLDFDKHICKDGDIIRIGLNYNLILSILDPDKKLSVSSDFQRVEEQSNNSINEYSDTIERQVRAPQQKQEPRENENVIAAGLDFYMPTKKTDTDNSNNKTIII